MINPKKRRRAIMLASGGLLLVAAAVLAGFAFDRSFAFFVTPSELAAEPPAPDRLLRLGGLVVEGSVAPGENGFVAFEVTDTAQTVRVTFTGILPDLFREGQGVVAQGRWQDGRFAAIEILAKHDENYVAAEVEDALKAQGVWRGDN